MSTEPSKLIGTKLSFQMNHASICGTMMAAFTLDTMQSYKKRSYQYDGSTLQINETSLKTRGYGTSPLRVKRNIEDVSSKLNNGS
ncbi:UNVERIFIED_CONTAM: hypothetical protein NCL1_22121 [Trichonephila clavipes]